MKSKILLFLIALLVVNGSMAFAARSPAKPRKVVNMPKIVEEANRCSLAMFNFFQSNVAVHSHLALSGVSVQYALGMLALATNGTTQEEVLRAMGWTGSADEVGKQVRLFNDELRRPKGVVLETANSVWLAADTNPKAAFVRAVADTFGAEVRPLDFSHGQDPAVSINKWVHEKTHGKITEIVAPPLPTHTVMTILHAIYFLGNWEDPFDVSRTRPAIFTALGSKTKEVQMMHQSGIYAYGEYTDIQVLRMPYKEKHVAMTVLLPKNEDIYLKLRRSFDEKSWEGLRNALEEGKQGQIALPRFEVTDDHQLNTFLQSRGIIRAFSVENADLSGLTSERRIAISQSFQRAFVKVDEQGTEAAATTAMLVTRGLPPEDKFTFTADHPFLFVIEDLDSGAILLLGAIQNP